MASTTKSAKKVGKAKTSPSTRRLEAKKTGAEGKDKAEKRKVGRPTYRTQEMLKTICEGIATGKSARAMCIEVGISQPTLWKWIGEDAGFSKQYARAKEDCADYLAAEIVEIADDGTRDYTVDKDGRDVVDHDHIARARLRVDARKWYASKLAPKKYGDRTLLSGDEDSPLKVEVTRIERVIIDPGHTKD
ncbi:hypothetical protein [Aquidulcibacter sp.]|uniref:terminase small subunit-like protein n=1 Tax=Aquidulcibacter sp. TaxID=2052990 RepID=UPI0025BD9287|nr:hypothetical protein [Aquidulcibacter sp.]MCA3064996.1 hypothetical protein [Rhodocyclaceae bacterium]MCA3694258.1 hypothetical protein [Aquidulcibacter sp.]